MTARFRVDSVGPYVSFQDNGRPGHMRYGVPPSGPMDRLAFRVLQRCLRAKERFIALEVSAGGLQLQCVKGTTTASVVGGKFHVRVDDKELAPWSVFEISKGQSLTISSGGAGSWAYLGFAGNPSAPEWLGSHSNHLYSGLCGRPLQTGDELLVNAARVEEHWHRPLTIPRFSLYSGSARVVLGPQQKDFTTEAIDTFKDSAFSISPNYNRMGTTLEGPSLAIERSLELPSEALVRGAVQVTGDGKATVLMADHQTTGGYPKIATVISSDIDQLAQARPGNSLRFVDVSVEEAITIRRRSSALIASYLDSV